MPNLTAARAVAGVVEPDHGLMKNVKTAYVLLNVGAADLTLNAVHGMFRLPRNAVVLGGTLKASDLDTNVAPTITLSVGDAAVPGRYFLGSTVAQAGGATNVMAATGVFFKNLVDTLVNVTVAIAAATPAAGTIELAIQYYVDI
jgi:hypothetical protein